MGNLHLCLLLLAAGPLLCAAAPYRANITDVHTRAPIAVLSLDNAYEGGDWGEVDMCPDGCHVHAFEILYAAPGHNDETAINGLKFYCSSDSEHTDVAYITSTLAPEGSWQGMRVCSHNKFMTGFRGEVLKYQGIFTDDVALEDFDAECNHGDEVVVGIPNQDHFGGSWSSWARCPAGSAICGLQTRVEQPQLMDDDTAVTDLQLFCCRVGPEDPTTTEAPSTTEAPTTTEAPIEPTDSPTEPPIEPTTEPPIEPTESSTEPPIEPTTEAPESTSLAPEPTTTAAPQPTTTLGPKPTTTQPPIPTTTLGPKPTTTQLPIPTTTLGPKPTTIQPPISTTTLGPKPTTTQLPQPTTTLGPKPTTNQSPKPTTTLGPKPTTEVPTSHIPTRPTHPPTRSPWWMW